MIRVIATLSFFIWFKIGMCQNWYNASENIHVFSIQHLHFFTSEIGFMRIIGKDNYTTGLYSSNDGGKSWQAVHTIGKTGMVTGLNPVMVNDSVAFQQLFGVDTLNVSLDKGNSWNPLTRPFSHNVERLLVTEDALFIVDHSDRGTWATFDYGKSIIKVTDFSLSSYQRGLNLVNDSILYCIADFNNDDFGIAISMNYGKSWQKTNHNPPYQYDYSKFHTHFIAPDTAVGYSRRSKYIYWTYNEGQSWDSIKHEIDFNSHIDDVKFADKDTGFAVVDARRLFKTCDGGKKWKEIHYFDCNQNYIGLIDAQNVYFYSTANNQGCISKTRNGGGDFAPALPQIL